MAWEEKDLVWKKLAERVLCDQRARLERKYGQKSCELWLREGIRILSYSKLVPFLDEEEISSVLLIT